MSKLWELFKETDNYKRGFESLTGIRQGWDTWRSTVVGESTDPYCVVRPDFTFSDGIWFDSPEAAKDGPWQG